MLRIKEVLKEKGITQAELADKLGVGQVSINRLINGNPRMDSLKKIADILNVSVSDLISDQEPGSKTLYLKEGNSYVPIGTVEPNVIKKLK